MEILISIILSTIAVFVTANILPNVHVSGWGTALILAIVLGVINSIIRPILFILTLPINILTLGLFTLVIVALCVLLASMLVPGFEVGGFWSAMAFGVVLAIISSLLGTIRI